MELVLNTLAVGVAVPLAAFVLGMAYRMLTDPGKSLAVHALNVAMWPQKFLRLGPFKRELGIESAVASALRKRKADKAELGNTSFLRAYNTVLKCKTMVAQRRSVMGFMAAKVEMMGAMVRRIDLSRFVRDVPAVLSVPLRPPVIVMGLPRTGTTLLHRLLSLDPEARSPITWELLAPVPYPRDQDLALQEKDRQKRRKKVDGNLKYVQFLAGAQFEAIHEFGTDLPEECLLALTNDLPVLSSMLFACFAEPDAVGDDEEVILEAFRAYRNMLQLLSWQVGQTELSTQKRWTLKCPGHLVWLKGIKDAFPDAHIVWTHRHPVKAVPSLASLLKVLHGAYFEPGLDLHELGRTVMSAALTMVTRAAEDLHTTGLSHSHVMYDNLVAEPLETVKSVYNQLGLTYTDEYDRILREHLAADEAKRAKMRSKGGGGALHTYAPEDYGLSAGELRAAFETYTTTFNIAEAQPRA